MGAEGGTKVDDSLGSFLLLQSNRGHHTPSFPRGEGSWKENSKKLSKMEANQVAIAIEELLGWINFNWMTRALQSQVLVLQHKHLFIFYNWEYIVS